MHLDDLITDILRRWPRTDEGELRAWRPTWVNTIGRYQGKTLAAGWELLCSEWTKTTRPNPGDVKAYCEKVHHRMHRPAVVDHVPSVSEDFTRRCIQIEDEWLRQNDDLTSQSRLEGWFMALRDWAREGANILAQRERNRGRGLTPAPLGERYPWLRSDGEREFIIRPPAERVEVWRNAYAARVPRGNLKVPA